MSKRYATEAWVLPTLTVRPAWEEVDIAARHVLGRMLAREGLRDDLPPWKWQAQEEFLPEWLDPQHPLHARLELPRVRGAMVLQRRPLPSPPAPTEADRYRHWRHRLDHARYRLPHLDAKVGRLAAINACWWLAVEGPSHQLFRLVIGAWAASLADHTAGLIHSEAGLWEYERFPATPRAFEQWFFRPEHCAFTGWAERTRKHWQRIAHLLQVEDE